MYAPSSVSSGAVAAEKRDESILLGLSNDMRNAWGTTPAMRPCPGTSGKTSVAQRTPRFRSPSNNLRWSDSGSRAIARACAVSGSAWFLDWGHASPVYSFAKSDPGDSGTLCSEMECFRCPQASAASSAPISRNLAASGSSEPECSTSTFVSRSRRESHGQGLQVGVDDWFVALERHATVAFS